MKGAQCLTTETERTLDQSKKMYKALIVLGIVIVAFNLRPGMTSVGPLIGTIRDDVGLANWGAGLLTSLPLIAFAIVSPIVPRMSQRWTNELTMVFGLLIIVIGILTRSLAIVPLLFLGTVLVGLGIAVCNVLLPGVVKEKFPDKAPLMTSVYSTTMGILAAVASGLSVPLAHRLGLGWQLSLVVWIIPAIIGAFIWLYIYKKSKQHQGDQDKIVTEFTTKGSIWRDRLAWQVALFMGLQSSLFYITISWLPEIFQSNGLDRQTAGWLLSYTQLIGMPASFLVPVIAGKMRSQRSLVIILGVFAWLGFGGLLLEQSLVITILSTTFIGIMLGGAFALALTFLAVRARTAINAGMLSGMAQSIGYLIAALGPVFMGYLYDLNESWTIPLFVLLVITCFVVLFGLGAARDKYVLE